MLEALRGLGVLVAVDGFGAGYSSVAKMHALKPDVIKIDGSLFSAHDDAHPHGSLLHGFTKMAHQFGALVVAEGIETSAQLAAALSAGCDAMQGNLLGEASAAGEPDRTADADPTLLVGAWVSEASR